MPTCGSSTVRGGRVSSCRSPVTCAVGILGVLEVVVMLFRPGHSRGRRTAAVIETLGSGVRFATFLVPGVWVLGRSLHGHLRRSRSRRECGARLQPRAARPPNRVDRAWACSCCRRARTGYVRPGSPLDARLADERDACRDCRRRNLHLCLSLRALRSSRLSGKTRAASPAAQRELVVRPFTVTRTVAPWQRRRRSSARAVGGELEDAPPHAELRPARITKMSRRRRWVRRWGRLGRKPR